MFSIFSFSSFLSLVITIHLCADQCWWQVKVEGHHTNKVGLTPTHWKWEYVNVHFLFSLLALLMGLCKVAFHYADILSSVVPESCLLIWLGTFLGGVLYAANREIVIRLQSVFSGQFFFLILLPPIILDSAYSLHSRQFFNNLGSILVFAVIGTLLTTFLIGISLWALVKVGAIIDFKLDLITSFMFGSLISAVDPVAVLAIFQDLGVNQVLYFSVFGESLLNDAVTVVLYETFEKLGETGNLAADQIVLAIITFFTVSGGGLLIGIIFGTLTALITRVTSNVRVVEPLFVLAMAYLSHLTAEMFAYSGIISLIGCGLVQAEYVKTNISNKSHTTVKYFVKMLSGTFDAIIFLFLGLSLIHDEHWFLTEFVVWTVCLCLAVRFLCVFILTRILNKFSRVRPYDTEEVFLMGYGGLRGAVAFSLAKLLKHVDGEVKGAFLTATLSVIVFTAFIQGITIKPLVRLLRIKVESPQFRSMTTEIVDSSIDHIMAGIEEIVGMHGINWFREIFKTYNQKVVKKILQGSGKATGFMGYYERMADHRAGPADSNLIVSELGKKRQRGSRSTVSSFVGTRIQEPPNIKAILRLPSAIHLANIRNVDYNEEDEAQLLLQQRAHNARRLAVDYSRMAGGGLEDAEHSRLQAAYIRALSGRRHFSDANPQSLVEALEAERRAEVSESGGASRSGWPGSAGSEWTTRSQDTLRERTHSQSSGAKTPADEADTPSDWGGLRKRSGIDNK